MEWALRLVADETVEGGCVLSGWTRGQTRRGGDDVGPALGALGAKRISGALSDDVPLPLRDSDLHVG